MRHIESILALALAYCLIATQAFAAWGTVTLVPTSVSGWTHCSSCATRSLTLNGSVAANNLVMIAFVVKGTALSTETFSATDSNGGDSFTVLPCQNGAGGTNFSGIAYVVTAGLVSTNTITFKTVSTSNASDIQFVGLYVTGGLTSSPEDTSVKQCNFGTATTTPTVTSGSPSQTGDLILSTYGGYAASGTLTEDASWISIGKNSDTNAIVGPASIVDATTGTVSRNPTTANLSYTMNTVGFKVSGGTPASHNLIFQPVP